MSKTSNTNYNSVSFLVLDINDVKLIGQVINGPRNSEKATYLDVATRNFNRYTKNAQRQIDSDLFQFI